MVYTNQKTNIKVRVALFIVAIVISGLYLFTGKINFFTNLGLHQAQAATSQIYYGAYVKQAEWFPQYLTDFETHAGKGVAIKHWFMSWSPPDCGGCQNFQTGWMDDARNHGSIPMITWEPWNYTAGANQPNFSLANIINGTHDAFITQWANDAKNWGHPFFLRFAHEMNADWYSWSELKNGNSAGQYVQAWRHVHDIFTSVGANNVTWVWAPNIEYQGSIALAGLYPGDNYVDWVGIDGYNWGSTVPNGKWTVFSDVFTNTYEKLSYLAPSKPMMISETASAEAGGSKPSWITDTYTTQIPNNFPRIKAIVWFNENKETDWRIESSAATQTAFAQAISNPMYTNNIYSTFKTSPIPPADGVVPAPPPAPSLVQEAENMTLQRGADTLVDSTASNFNSAVIYANVTASKTLNLQPTTKIVVRSKGDQCNGAPNMLVLVDNSQVFQSTVPNTYWTNYSIPVNLTAGNHTVTVKLTNDYKKGGCDRDLRLDKISFY